MLSLPGQRHPTSSSNGSSNSSLQAVAAAPKGNDIESQAPPDFRSPDDKDGRQKQGSNEGSAFIPGSRGPSLPPVSLPSGGGSIRGMGENLSMNAAQGTASFKIPVPLSPCRHETEPQLSLEYAPGNGSGVFGLGWSLGGMVNVTRSTRNGLPMYEGAEIEDIFNVSEAEDLVPVYEGYAVGDPGLQASRERDPVYKIKEIERNDRFLVRQYRPRIEGSYSRIERWTDSLDPEDIHWRVLSTNNELTILGRDDNSRICSVVDDRKRIFSWLPCEWYDCYGNARLYEYKQENGDGVNLAQAHERNRTDRERGSQRHLKRIKYGNRKPVVDRNTVSSAPPELSEADWMFEVVFDYGEHSLSNPLPVETQGQPWECRQDPFSSFKSGFEVRTYRLCKRILMFHHFPEPAPKGLGQRDYLVKAMEIGYDKDPAVSHLQNVQLAGFVLRSPSDPPAADSEKGGPYYAQRLPPLDLEYTTLPSDEEMKILAVQEFDLDTSIENVPEGVQGSSQWLDLLGEGTTGIFVAAPDGEWYYKANLSPANEETVEQLAGDPVTSLPVRKIKPKFAPMQRVGSRPALLGFSNKPSFSDLDANGELTLLVDDDIAKGFYSRRNDSAEPTCVLQDLWQSYQPFPSWPSIDMKDPNLRLIDLTGDGKADILICHNDVFVWYASLGTQGFASTGNTIGTALNEEQGPRIVFADPSESIHLADFSGDGLIDIVRVRNGDVCYWPNLGYGRFGSKISLDNVPAFDSSESFSSQRLILGDIDGSGTTDLIYFRDDGADIYYNCAGNSLSPSIHVGSWPRLDQGVSVAALDILGSGSMCLVWSSSHPTDAHGQTLRYVDLSGGQKPHLLSRVITNTGKETGFTYRSSTAYYLEDLAAGKPWATRLPFPQHCVDRIITYDTISKVSFSQRYAYHHGYYDSTEREFRGFGMVEQWDAEAFGTLHAPQNAVNTSQETYVPPTHTKSWFHTGAFADHEKLSRAYSKEYFGAPDPSSSDYSAKFETFFNGQLRDYLSLEGMELTADELREASRAFKGSILRTEVYADDHSPKADRPFQIVDTGNAVRLLQPRGTANQYAIFMTYARENLTHHLERELTDPRVQHEITLVVDGFGNERESATIAYGRVVSAVLSTDVDDQDIQQQQKMAFTYSSNDFTQPVIGDDDYRTPQPSVSQQWEVSLSEPVDQPLGRYTPEMLAHLGDIESIPFEQTVSGTSSQKRLLAHIETQYRADDLGGLFDVGKQGVLGLPGVNFCLCLTSSMIARAFKRDGKTLIEDLSGIGGYSDRNSKTNWWAPSAQTFYHPDPNANAATELKLAQQTFFTAQRSRDAFGHDTVILPDAAFLQPIQVTDVKGNVTVGELDYRTLQTHLVTDPNGNRTEVAFDALGMAVGFATMGKKTESLGDTLGDFRPNLSNAEIDAYFLDPKQNALGPLARATSRLVYDPNFYYRNDSVPPIWTSTITRENHLFSGTASGTLPITESSKTHVLVTYVDGHGREIQAKAQAESAPSQPDKPLWRGTGWTIFNNKGQPVQQFEPFFDDSHRYTFNRREGVSSIQIYDALNRPLAVVHPNKTWSKQIRDPWQVSDWDMNDTISATILEDDDLAALVKSFDPNILGPSWFESRKDGQLGPHEKDAAEKAAAHAKSPSNSYYDAQGKAFVVVKDNKKFGKIKIRVKYDIQGNVLDTSDGLNRTVTTNIYSMCGQTLCTASTDFGTRWALSDIDGQLVHAWDSRGFHIRTEYDELRRTIATFVQRAGAEALMHKVVYGEDQPNSQAHNLRGRQFREYDQAGIVTQQDYDFKGNSLIISRQYAVDYKSTVDWTDPSKIPLESNIYDTSQTFDALNRVVTSKHPDATLVRFTFNDGDLPLSVSANLKGAQSQTVIISSTEYDAHGRIVAQTGGNNTTTTNSYDPLTNSLTRRTTVSQRGKTRSVVQDLIYTYDPVGNVTWVENGAEQTIFFRNKAADSHFDYTYDALYRLIQAKGRENIGQTLGRPPGPGGLSSQVALNASSFTPTDGSAMVRYTETYTYDAANSITSLHHEFTDNKLPAWNRQFSYEIVAGQRASNRLVSTAVGGVSEQYSYDAHGNTTAMPHLSKIQWDYANEMHSSAKQKVNSGSPETTWYVYDGHGERVRKVTERHSASGVGVTKLSERLSVGDFEIYRQYAGDGATITQSCETLHVEGPSNDAAVVEDWTGGKMGSFRLFRFQLHDLLGSVGVELDETGSLLSYEEFMPYGSTSHQSPEVKAPKRFRFSSKERDTDNGLDYFGLRYYIPWLGRWLNPDPIGIEDGLNVYEYCACNPTRYHDPHGTAGSDTEDEPAPKRARTGSAAASSSSITGFSASSSFAFSPGAGSASFPAAPSISYAAFPPCTGSAAHCPYTSAFPAASPAASSSSGTYGWSSPTFGARFMPPAPDADDAPRGSAMRLLRDRDYFLGRGEHTFKSGVDDMISSASRNLSLRVRDGDRWERYSRSRRSYRTTRHRESGRPKRHELEHFLDIHLFSGLYAEAKRQLAQEAVEAGLEPPVHSQEEAVQVIEFINHQGNLGWLHRDLHAKKTRIFAGGEGAVFRKDLIRYMNASSTRFAASLDRWMTMNQKYPGIVRLAALVKQTPWYQGGWERYRRQPWFPPAPSGSSSRGGGGSRARGTKRRR